VIRGEVTYPWGKVAKAIVKVKERISPTNESAKSGSAAESTKAAESLSSTSDSGNYEAPFPGYDAVPKDIVLAPGETKVLDFVMDFEKTLVEGHVLDEDGKPIPYARLSEVKCGKYNDNTTTDATGYFRFDNASPGNLFIRVNAAGFMSETRDFTARKGETTTLEFRLVMATCKIFGIITDDEGHPLAGEIHLSSESRVLIEKAVSDPQTGHYECPILPGTYGILANAPGHFSEGWRGVISKDTELNLKLKKPRPVAPEE
jgi:hypothetical protein